MLTISKTDINSDLKIFDKIYFVYYLYYNDLCIYIGSSMNIYKRFKEHKYQKEFDYIKLRPFRTANQAKTFENIEINRLKPEFNTFNKESFKVPQLAKNVTFSIEDKKKFANILNRN